MSYDQNLLWSEEEDNAVRVYYPTHGSKWEGWAEVLPNRTYRAISARACRIGVGRKWVYKRGKSKSRKKPVGDDRHYKVDFKPTPDPYERRVLGWLGDGMTPTEIDESMHWYHGTTVRILTEMWAREDHDTDTEGTTR